MQKRIYFSSRQQAREFIKNGNPGKVIDNGTDANGWRWMVEFDEPDSQSIKSVNIVASKAANASPVVNRDNSRVLVSRNKREGKYAGRRRYWPKVAGERKHVRGGKDNWRYVL